MPRDSRVMEVETRPATQFIREVSNRSNMSAITGISQMITAPEPSASAKTTAVNLMKNTMGVGILSVPDAFNMGSIIPTTVLTIGLIAINVWTMSMVGYLCEKYGGKSYRELWTKIVGPRFAWITDAFICLNGLFGCLSCCLLAGSWLTQSLSSMFGSMFANRVVNTTVVTTFVLFPLAMLRDLNALRHTSAAGVGCVLFGICFVVAEMGLHWSEHIPTRTCQPIQVSGACTSPEVFEAGIWQPSLKLVPAANIIASMMMCHYNIPKMYGEFYRKDPKVFGRIVLNSISFAGVSACVLGIAGLLRFGSEMPPGNILGTFEQDFPPGGTMSGTERSITLFTYLVSSVNIASSFPLLFSALRISFLQLCGKTVRELEVWQYTTVTFGLVAFCLVLGLSVPHLTFVSMIKGAICSMCVSYIFPAMWLWLDMDTPRSATLVLGVVILLSIGFSLMIYGIVDVLLF